MDHHKIDDDTQNNNFPTRMGDKKRNGQCELDTSETKFERVNYFRWSFFFSASSNKASLNPNTTDAMRL